MNAARAFATIMCGFIGVGLLIMGTSDGRWIGIAYIAVALLVKPPERAA